MQSKSLNFFFMLYQILYNISLQILQTHLCIELRMFLRIFCLVIHCNTGSDNCTLTLKSLRLLPQMLTS
jgi:hypothetical protein